MRAACFSVLPLVVPLIAAPESYPCQNGLVRTLVAREPMFTNPVSVAVDTDGTIYVTETTRRKQADLDIREVMWWVTDDLSHTSVEEKRDFFRKNITSERFRNHPSLKDHDGNGRIDWRDLTVHTEKIHRLVDTDGDGMADRHTLFAEGFNTEVTGIAAGVFAHRGDVYATIAPDVWKLRDTDGDGKADERQSIAHGFGVHINYAGHDMHGLTLGPDGKLYWTIGDKGLNVESGGKRWAYPHEGAVLRCNPDGSDFEVFAHGLRNVQEIAFDEYGYLFGVDNDSDQKGEKERLVYIPERSDHGWRCYYQYRSGKYNPWMDEHIAFPDGEGRPASIIPPLALYLDGPSGFAYNPGTALNERYRGHFFLTQFPAGKINAFQLEADGASFKMKGDHLMASGTAFTGCNFGPDGALYVADWQGGYPLKEKGAVWKIDDPKEAGSAMRKEVAAMLKEGPSNTPDEALAIRLGHADQRVRLDAQWELATRKKWQILKEVAASKNAPQLARIHALWGLSQGEQFDEKLFSTLAEDQDPELRAQAAKWAGETTQSLPSSFTALLADDSARVRFQAAMAVGKSGDKAHLDPVIAMLEANDNKDPFLRHAGAFALKRSITSESIATASDHQSPAVRLAVVVAARAALSDTFSGIDFKKPDEVMHQEAKAVIMAGSTVLNHLLEDTDSAVVSEAAWALYDVRPPAGYCINLAKLLEKKPAASEPTLRRSIAANRRSGSLLPLATFAMDPAQPEALRIAALEALASAKSAEPLDLVDGRHAPLDPLDVSPELASKLAKILSPLAAEARLSSAANSALEALGVKRDAASLTKRALDSSLAADLRIAALRQLKESGDAKWSDTALALLTQDSPALRSAAAGLLEKQHTKELAGYLESKGLGSTDTSERQAAVRLLRTNKSEATRRLLDEEVARFTRGEFDPSALLELDEAYRVHHTEDPDFILRSLAERGPLGKWSYALAGGNTAAGKKVFEENLSANCTACHRIGEQGSNVGPPLTKIGEKDRSYLLESLVHPQAKVASGYGMMSATKKDGTTVAGAFVEDKDGKLVLAQADGTKLEITLADIAAKTDPISTMPPMDAILKPTELRDLVEFLASLK
ncbi:c-type cytochrome [Luteolibacter flavescens]|uniref:C-type cytochrome n=1 Tax=Luteolibacter flavescens TaxID=1859460 RepID=A0ABT3FIX2_9BACT|nr:PVC-type heme-binding CxxCH protein [Luteolibacter flavescens]MCW1883490.1 c-type cytochrome [Luteolibacter flavescens]